MDMALCVFNMAAKKVEFAGANNPLILIRDKQIIKYKGDRFPIGAFEGSNAHGFKNNEIDLQEGDCLYLASDGYADQFGGPENKKFMFRKYEELLLEINSLPMDAQKKMLHDRLYEWMGDNDQVDDILVIGIKI
jgi:serine phosphatase RsbU (regulator of sigma subunit)